jgi:hypothetical protein
LTNLLNEVFVTLFADNQGLISAVTPGSYEAPLTYSLGLGEGLEDAEKCIFIIEDSQLDIGLLIAVERNINRILQIIADYLAWNEEQIAASLRKKEAPVTKTPSEAFDVYSEDKKEKKKGIFKRFGQWFKSLFKKKRKGETDEAAAGTEEELTPKQRKKAERAAAKAEKKAAKEQKKAQKQEEKARKEQEKAEKKAAKAAEETPEETPETAEAAPEEEPVVEETEVQQESSEGEAEELGEGEVKEDA